MEKVIFFCFYICLSLTIISCGESDGSSENKITWSQNAITTSQSRISSWTLKNYLKVDTNGNKAYFNPLFWDEMNVDEKKEAMLSVVVFTDDLTGKENNFYDFYDYQSGKQIASWNKVTGFDFDY